jgi:hypothetical protein
VTQGLQDFFALVLGNFPAALFSQVSHDRSLYFFCFVDIRTSMQCITFFCFFKYHSVFFQLSCSKTFVFFQKKEKKTAPDGKKRAGTGKKPAPEHLHPEEFFSAGPDQKRLFSLSVDNGGVNTICAENVENPVADPVDFKDVAICTSGVDGCVTPSKKPQKTVAGCFTGTFPLDFTVTNSHRGCDHGVDESEGHSSCTAGGQSNGRKTDRNDQSFEFEFHCDFTP